jgi:large subunit ribosomal protein L3
MISGFIARKGTMTSRFLPDGRQIAVTICKTEPLKVTQVKTPQTDGYQAIQFAYGSRRTLKNPVSKKLTKLGIDLKPFGFIEFKPLSVDQLPTVGQDVTIDQVFAVGDMVDVTGVSKGRGFAGVIKRYGFQRQPVSGGQSDRTRAPGAIGAQTPGKVLKGKRMPGHYGNHQITVSHLRIIDITPNQEIVLSGPIPGAINSWITISKKA